MALQLHELAGEDPARVFSPYCWRSRMALAHKGLTAETLPWRFMDKQAIADGGTGLVPVLRDGDSVVADSWAIAEYLEDHYPDRPSLFGGEAGRALTKFVNSWADTVVVAGIAPLVVADVPRWLTDADRAYFIPDREARFGRPLATLAADRDRKVLEFRRALQPMRKLLRERPFLGGTAPLYADYIVFGGFQWARCISDFALLEQDDPIHAWRDRLLDAFGGLARAAPAEN